MFAVVRVESGLLEGVTLFKDREKALRFGRDQFERATDGVVEDHSPNLWCHAQTNDPDFDEEWGGIARGFVMHWETPDVDVWVTEPSGPVIDRPLCPFCRNGAIDGERYGAIVGQLGEATIEAVLESIDPPYEEESDE